MALRATRRRIPFQPSGPMLARAENDTNYGPHYGISDPGISPGRAPASPAIDPNWNFSNGPAPSPNPSPFDSIYENAISGINRQTGDTLANLQYEEGQLSPTYGYQTDTEGKVSVDPSNPFSKAALLQRSYDQGQARSGNQMAAQGQLYSGAYQNAQDAGTRGFQQNSDVLRRAYQNALQSVRARRTAAQTNQSINTNAAYGDAIQRALANRPA